MIQKQKIHHLQFLAFLILISASLPISVFGGLALAFICGIASLVAIIGGPYLHPIMLFFRHYRLITISFMLLCGLALISLNWTLNEQAAFAVWIRVALLIGGSGFLLLFVRSLTAEEKLTLARWLTISFIITLALFFFERVTDGLIIRTIKAWFFHDPDYIPKLSGMNRGACYISLMFFSLAAFWHDRNPRIVLALGLITFALLCSLASLSAVMGFAAGAVTFIFVKRYANKKFDRYLIALIILTAIIFPFANLYTNPPAVGDKHLLPLSSIHRLYIWKFSSQKIMEKPIRGWGFDAAPFIPGGSDLIAGRLKEDWKYLPLHTHNSIIQVWLELGIFGVVLLVGIFGGILTAIRRSLYPTEVKAALSGLVMGYFAIGLTGFGIWQFWWIGAGFLSAATLIAVAHDKDSKA